MSKPEPKFEVGDLVRHNFRYKYTGKVGIVTKVGYIGNWGYNYKITGIGWATEHNLTLLSSVKGAANEQT